MPNLRELQQAFFHSLRARAMPTPASADPALLAIIAGPPPLDSRERIDIYAEMYAARLIDALAETFAKTAELTGTERFQVLARAYIAASPSTHPSLRCVGAGFSALLAHSEGVPSYLADLARLEWARLEVFDAPDCVPLALESLRGVRPEHWHTLEMRPIPALLKLRTRWPVHEIWAAGKDAASAWGPANTVLRVWRRDFLVYQASMDATEEAAFAELEHGTTFGALCGQFAQVHGPAAPREAAALLLRWIDDGLLAGTR